MAYDRKGLFAGRATPLGEAPWRCQRRHRRWCIKVCEHQTTQSVPGMRCRQCSNGCHHERTSNTPRLPQLFLWEAADGCVCSRSWPSAATRTPGSGIVLSPYLVHSYTYMSEKIRSTSCSTFIPKRALHSRAEWYVPTLEIGTSFGIFLDKQIVETERQLRTQPVYS